MFYYAYTLILSQPSIGLEDANIVAQIYIHLYSLQFWCTLAYIVGSVGGIAPIFSTWCVPAGA